MRSPSITDGYLQAISFKGRIVIVVVLLCVSFLKNRTAVFMRMYKKGENGKVLKCM